MTAFDPERVLGLAQVLLGSLIGVLSSLFLIVVLLLAMSLDAPVDRESRLQGRRSPPAPGDRASGRSPTRRAAT